jgi:hypothetical protein
MIPQPQVIEFTDEIPPEFTRSVFADLFDRPLQRRPEEHAQQPLALQRYQQSRPAEAARY